MTKKDFIRILLKLTGIYLLFSSLPPLFGPIVTYSKESWEMLLGLVLIIIVFIAFSSWLIFYPDTLIKFFRLNKGFDDDEIKTDRLKSENFISFAVIIIGGIFIVHSFVPLIVDICQRVHYAVAENNSFFVSFERLDNSRLYTNIIELFIGCFLITNYSGITRFLAKKNKNNETA